MRLKGVVLGTCIAFCAAFSASAQELIDGNDVNEILTMAKLVGTAELGKQDNGDPLIDGTVDGVIYKMFMQNCTDNRNCEDVRFYAGFADNKPTMEVINAWNRDKRFGKAFLDSDLDAVIEFDVNLEHGVARQNMEEAFGLWKLLLDQYTTYIGYK